MKFLYKIYSENQNLNNFQRQVFDLSKDYDDINNIMEEGISGFKEIAKGTKNENIQNLVDEKLKELKTEIETSLEQKQKEYNEQLNKKEEEINMLTKAYDNIYKEVQQKNSDKIHEQMTIKNLNSQIEILETKLAFLKDISSVSEYLIIIPLLVHSFKSQGNISLPIIPFIIVVLPAFEPPKNGMKITSYVFKYSMIFIISSVKY